MSVLIKIILFISEIGLRLCKFANCTLPGATKLCPEGCPPAKAVLTTSNIKLNTT